MIIATQPYLISRVIDFIAVAWRSGINRADSKRWKAPGGDWIALSSIEDIDLLVMLSLRSLADSCLQKE